MAKFFFTKRAVIDISGIWDYTVMAWSEQQAEKYYNQIIETCKEISINQSLGKAYDGIAPTLRGIRINRHVIFFRSINTESIEITRILHETMDLKRRMTE